MSMVQVLILLLAVSLILGAYNLGKVHALEDLFDDMEEELEKMEGDDGL